MKNAVFFSRPRRYGRFFGRCRNHQNGGQKSPQKNTQTDAKSHVLSAFPVKKSYEHQNSRRHGEMWAALEDGARASKIRILDGTVSPSLRRQEGRRRRMRQGCSEILWMLRDALGCPVRSSGRFEWDGFERAGSDPATDENLFNVERNFN